MNIQTIIKGVAFGALILAAVPSFGATQGKVGDTSSFGITLNIQPKPQLEVKGQSVVNQDKSRWEVQTVEYEVSETHDESWFKKYKIISAQ
ncbi:hypothetical protein [Endozoicomonas sp. ALB032]|uniref:hypothetical protein n=1 Tax=Endozoicomonas sp. ALB032 TaxID=3403082 RepID=UPI003BB4D564